VLNRSGTSRIPLRQTIDYLFKSFVYELNAGVLIVVCGGKSRIFWSDSVVLCLKLLLSKI
jgi:hypothetical protein